MLILCMFVADEKVEGQLFWLTKLLVLIHSYRKLK